MGNSSSMTGMTSRKPPPTESAWRRRGCPAVRSKEPPWRRTPASWRARARSTRRGGRERRKA
eukprot:137857-Alexandrium_andersonii.AAC.1